MQGCSSKMWTNPTVGWKVNSIPKKLNSVIIYCHSNPTVYDTSEDILKNVSPH